MFTSLAASPLCSTLLLKRRAAVGQVTGRWRFSLTFFGTLLVILWSGTATSQATASELVLHAFMTNNAGKALGGAVPYSALVGDSGGNLYGTTPNGGAFGYGVVFELSRSTGGTWTEKVLHDFSSFGDGAAPYAGLAFDTAGNLYGTTAGGGSTDGGGTIFRLSPGNAGSWKESILYRFDAYGSGPYFPLSGLIIDSAGNLYGDTRDGGLYSGGTVYMLSPGNGDFWRLAVLYDFGASATDGTGPEAPYPTMDSMGNLYGTTYHGGLYGVGVVYRLSPTGSGLWTETILYNFSGGPDGGNPNPALTFDSGGSLYGGTNNPPTVFKLSPGSNDSWSLSTIQTLNGTEQPMRSRFIFDSNGNLYGTANAGCKYGSGCVLVLKPTISGAWSRHNLYSFRDGRDGGIPQSGVIADFAGNLYGTTLQGGNGSSNFGLGVVFEIARQ